MGGFDKAALVVMASLAGAAFLFGWWLELKRRGKRCSVAGCDRPIKP